MRLFPIVGVLVGVGLTAAQPHDTGVTLPSTAAQRGQCDRIAEQLHALDALINMQAERAMPLLRTVLARRDECSEHLRRKAVFLVAHHAAPEAEVTLLDVAQRDPDGDARAKAVFWLSQVDTERAVSALDSILMHPGVDGLQERAIFALSQHASPRAADILRQYARRADRPLELREKAVFWIGQEGGREAGAFLQDLYEAVSEPALKEKIIFALSQRDDPQAIDALIQLARSEANPQLRKRAIFWLGQADDPRVATFLMELIGNE